MDLQYVLTALERADAAGDVEAARELAQLARSMSARPVNKYEQERQRLDREIAELRSRKVTPERTLGGNIKELVKGVIPGGIGLLETAGVGAAALLPEETERAAREGISGIAAAAKKPFEAAPGYEESPFRKIGEGLGSIVPMAPLGLLGAPGIIGGIGVGLAAGAGEARQAAEAKRATEGERAAATALGTIPGAFDAAVDMALAAFPGGAGKAIGFIRRALISGGTEGATEAAQQIAQNAIAKGVYDPSQELLTGSGEAAGYGAGVGALASVLFDIAIPGRRRGAAAPPPAAGPAATEPITDPSRLLPAPTLYGTSTGEIISGADRPEYEREQRERAAREQQEQKTAAREGIASLVPPPAVETKGSKPPPTDSVPSYTITYSDGSQIMGFGTPPTNLPEGATVTVEPAKQKPAETAAPTEEPTVAQQVAEATGGMSEEVQQQRMDVLIPLIEDAIIRPETTLPTLYDTAVEELRTRGFADLNLTDKELALLGNAFGMNRPLQTTTEVGAEGTVATEEKPTATESLPNYTVESTKNAERGLVEDTTVTFENGVSVTRGRAFNEIKFPKGSFTDTADVSGNEIVFTKTVNGKKLKIDASPTGISVSDMSTGRTTVLFRADSQKSKEVLDAEFAKQRASAERLLGKNAVDAYLNATTDEKLPALTKALFGFNLQPYLETAFNEYDKANQEMIAGGKKEEKTTAVEEKPVETAVEEKPTAIEEKPVGAAAPAATEAPTTPPTAVSTAITPEILGEVGLPKQSPFYKKLLNLDMAVPEQQMTALGVFDQIRSSRAFSQRTKLAVTNLIKRMQGNEGTRPTATATGTSTEGGKGTGRKGEPGAPAADTGAAETSKPSGLGDTGKPTSESGGRKGRKPASVKEVKTEEKPAEEKPSEQKVKAEAKAEGRQAFAENDDPVGDRNKNPYPKGTMQAEAWDDGYMEAYAKRYLLPKDAVRIFAPLDEAVVEKLKAGDLSGALETLASMLSGRDAAIARALSKFLKGTSVKLVKDLKSASGRILSGDFDYTNDTVSLDSKEGMNIHTLLHESTHAAIEKILTNPSHPVAKQLTNLFNKVKGSLDTAYGATNVSEFVAEALSNPEFQQKLAQIDPDGKQISAWTRFINAVANMFRSLTGAPIKGVGSALDAVDTLVGTVIAPNANSVGIGSLYQASVTGAIKDVFKSIDEKIVSLPGFDNAFVDKIYNMLSTDIPKFFSRTTLQGLPVEALVKVAERDIPMAGRLSTIESELGGALNRRKEEIDGTVKRIQRWVKGNPEKEVLLNRVIKESTLDEVDPSKPRDYYKGKVTKANEDKQAVWDKLQSDWESLEGEGQAIYKQMRDTYAEIYNELLNLLFKRVDASVADPEDAKKIRTELQKQFTLKGKIEPYFPLFRDGDYWLTYSTTDGEYYKMAFKTRTERARAMQLLKTEPTVKAETVKESLATSKYSFKDAPPTSFVNNVIKVLESQENKVPPEVIEQVMRVYLDTLPETSFAQAFRKRLGTLGFEENAVDVFYKKSITMAHQLGTLKYSNQLFALRDEMKNFVNERNNTERAQELFNVLDRHIATIVSPKIAPLAKALTSGTFFMTIGANISSVMANFAQVPLVIMPYLGGEYGYSKTMSAIGFANNMFLGSGLKRKIKMSGISAEERKQGKDVIEVKAGYSLDNYDFEALASKKAKGTPLSKKEQDILELRELSDLASSYGMFSRSIASDVLDMNDQDSVLSKINNVSGFLFHHGDRMTRQISLIATYKLELDRLRDAGKEITPEVRQAAAKKATQLTTLMNGGASANSAPLLAKNSIGKVMFMYKRYGVSMYYMLYQTAKEALKSENEQVRAAAKRQIAGIYGMSALLAGVQGMPMFGVAAALYNLILKGDDEDDFETLNRKYFGEGMFSGALNYFTNTAIAQRIGLSDLLLREPGYRNEDNKLLSLMQLVGGPVYGTADRLGRAAKLISEGEVQRGLEQASPAALSNVMKAYRYATEGTTTLRGDPITGEVGAWNIGAQALGFAPADYTLQLEINSNLKGIDRAVTEKRTKLLKQYFIAIRNGDIDTSQEVLDDLIEMNRKHPGVLKPDTIQKSVKQHFRTSAEMYKGITLSKPMRNELLQNAREYDKDTSLFGDEEQD